MSAEALRREVGRQHDGLAAADLAALPVSGTLTQVMTDLGWGPPQMTGGGLESWDSLYAGDDRG